MTAHFVDAPFQMITNANGYPLNNGYVYIGVAGTNPEINSITAYWDSNLSIPASQPIRTVNGFCYRNGSPGNLFVDADDYSITVKDINGALVYTELNAAKTYPIAIIGGAIASNLVTFLQSGVGAISRTVQNRLKEIVYATDFAAAGLSSGDDWTIAIQDALDELDSRGGGICMLPIGTLYLSIANSDNIYSCIVIPKNTILQGQGIGATILQYLPAERGTDGVLITNKNWNNNGGYTADGNIVLQDFTITDGAATPNRSNGDLIGLGHADAVTIQRVQSLNHDQHFVDICGSKNVKILNCLCYNESAISSTFCATLQIDGAATGAILGIYADDTPSKDIEIAYNHITNLTSLYTMQVAHKAMLFENISIHNNYFNGAYSSNQIVVGCDTNPSFKSLKITDNIIIPNHIGAKTLDIYTNGRAAQTMDGIIISRNNINGVGRRGIYVGTDVNYTASTFPGWTGLVISDNTIYLDNDGATTIGIEVAGFDNAIVKGNSVTIDQAVDTAFETYGIRINNNKSCLVTDNTIQKIIPSPGYTTVSAAIYLKPTVTSITEASHIIVKDNLIMADGHRFLIKSNDFTQYIDNIIVSANKMSGTPAATGYLIYEDWAISDGTNFRMPVAYSGIHILTITSGMAISGLLLPGKKYSSVATNHISPAKVDIVFSNTAAGFSSAAMVPNIIYLSSTSAAGVVVAGIDQFAGTFTIAVGNSGANCSISTSTFYPQIYATGYIKLWASI